MEPLVHVVILNYNRPDDTIECVNSVLASTYENYKIIVVDNASEENKYRALELGLPKSPRIMLLRTKINGGYSMGNNVGIRLALEEGADHVWILNNDTLVDKNALGYLVDSMTRSPRAGVAASTMFCYDRPREVWVAGGARKVSGLDVLLTRFGYYKDKDYDYTFTPEKQDCSPKPLVSAVGASMLVRREVFEEVGLLDEDFFLYREETEFLLRVLRAGWGILYSPCSLIWHKVGGRNDARISYYFVRNSPLLLKKSYGWRQASTGSILVTLAFTYSIMHDVAHRKYGANEALRRLRATALGFMHFWFGMTGRLDSRL
jgi:GT2 family glycosyltransferase